MKLWSPILPLLGPLLLIAALSILRAYLIHRAALRDGYGYGRSGLDWFTRGFGLLNPLSTFRPRSSEKQLEGVEFLPCPRCHAQRRFYQGFCTVCGCEIIQALIKEARIEEARAKLDAPVSPDGEKPD